MDITWGQLGKKLLSSAAEKRIPVYGQFELTARCNLKCRMCYICSPSKDKGKIAGELTKDEWLSLARDARDAGMLYLLLTGGEVFLREDFKEIYTELAHMGFCIEIYTNGTLITPEVARWLGRIPPSKVGITLYGGSPETYKRVCGCEQGYGLAVRGIDLLLEQGIVVDVKTTVTKDNYEDFDNISKIADMRKLDFGIVNYISPRREGGYTEPLKQRLSPEALVEYEKRAERYYISKCIPNNEECRYIGNEESAEYIAEDSSPYRCAAGRSSFWITWDGKITTCGLTGEPVSNPLEEGFLTAWRELQKFCASTPVCDECRACSLKEFCLTCPERLKSETGSYLKPARYLCDLARHEKNWINP